MIFLYNYNNNNNTNPTFLTDHTPTGVNPSPSILPPNTSKSIPGLGSITSGYRYYVVPIYWDLLRHLSRIFFYRPFKLTSHCIEYTFKYDQKDFLCLPY